jgi:hypothetical protein
MIDHRTAEFGSGDAQLLRRIYATTNEMADDLATGFDDVLVARPTALLTRWTGSVSCSSPSTSTAQSPTPARDSRAPASNCGVC